MVYEGRDKPSQDYASVQNRTVKRAPIHGGTDYKGSPKVGLYFREGIKKGSHEQVIDG